MRRTTCKKERRKITLHIARTLFRILCESFDCFPVLFYYFSLIFIIFFSLLSEVSSQDFNGNGDNWPRWLGICHFYRSRIHSRKLLRGDILYDVFHDYFDQQDATEELIDSISKSLRTVETQLIRFEHCRIVLLVLPIDDNLVRLWPTNRDVI